MPSHVSDYPENLLKNTQNSLIPFTKILHSNTPNSFIEEKVGGCSGEKLENHTSKLSCPLNKQ